VTDKTDFLWVDIETFGISTDTGPIIELGMALTDQDLNVKAMYQNTCWSADHDAAFRKLTSDLWVMKQHTKSGLFKDAKKTGLPTLGMLEDDALDWLKWHNATGLPMCGSSIHFDRGFVRVFLPRFETAFHYRNVDISTVKELCKRLNPPVYEKMEQYTDKKEAHRVIPDLEDTLAEARYYFDNFLWTV
jgi:oligoribonuclease